MSHYNLIDLIVRFQDLSKQLKQREETLSKSVYRPVFYDLVDQTAHQTVEASGHKEFVIQAIRAHYKPYTVLATDSEVTQEPCEFVFFWDTSSTQSNIAVCLGARRLDRSSDTPYEIHSGNLNRYVTNPAFLDALNQVVNHTATVVEALIETTLKMVVVSKMEASELLIAKLEKLTPIMQIMPDEHKTPYLQELETAREDYRYLCRRLNELLPQPESNSVQTEG